MLELNASIVSSRQYWGCYTIKIERLPLEEQFNTLVHNNYNSTVKPYQHGTRVVREQHAKSLVDQKATNRRIDKVFSLFDISSQRGVSSLTIRHYKGDLLED